MKVSTVQVIMMFRQVLDGDKLATIRAQHGLADDDPVPEHLLKEEMGDNVNVTDTQIL